MRFFSVLTCLLVLCWCGRSVLMSNDKWASTGSSCEISNGDKTVTRKRLNGINAWCSSYGTELVSSGVATWRVHVDAYSMSQMIGVAYVTDRHDLFPNYIRDYNFYAWAFYDSRRYGAGLDASFKSERLWHTGDVLDLTLDMTARSLSLSVNGQDVGIKYDGVYSVAAGQQYRLMSTFHDCTAGMTIGSDSIPPTPQSVSVDVFGNYGTGASLDASRLTLTGSAGWTTTYGSFVDRSTSGSVSWQLRIVKFTALMMVGIARTESRLQVGRGAHLGEIQDYAFYQGGALSYTSNNWAVPLCSGCGTFFQSGAIVVLTLNRDANTLSLTRDGTLVHTFTGLPSVPFRLAVSTASGDIVTLHGTRPPTPAECGASDFIYQELYESSHVNNNQKRAVPTVGVTGTATRSMGAWFKTATVGAVSDRFIISFGDATSGPPTPDLFSVSTTTNVFSQTSSVDATIGVPAGQSAYYLCDTNWHHIVVRWTEADSTLNVFVDGQLAGTRVHNGLQYVTKMGVQIGGWSFGDFPYYGLLRDVRFFDCPLSNAAIGEWHSAPHLAVPAVCKWSTSIYEEVAEKTYDGTLNSLRFIPNKGVRGNQARSFGGFITTTAANTIPFAFGSDPCVNAQEFALMTDWTIDGRSAVWRNAHTPTGGANMLDNQEHFVVVTYSGTSGVLKLYFDGVQVATSTRHALYPYGTKHGIYLGGWCEPTHLFIGKLRDVRFFDCELPAAEIVAWHTRTKAPTPAPQPSAHPTLPPQPTNAPTKRPTCNLGVSLDAVFLIDASGSIDVAPPAGQAFQVQLNFAADVAAHFKTPHRVGAVRFASEAEEVFSFTTPTSAAGQLISMPRNPSGSTDLGKGLQKSLDLFGSSSATKKLLFVVTDGLPDDDPCPKKALLNAAGIRVVMVGITTNPTYAPFDRNAAHITCLADAVDIFDTPTFDGLVSLIDTFGSVMCG